MKEFICKKDFYIEDTRFASIGDHVILLDDNRTVVNTNGKQRVTLMPDIVKDEEYFTPTFESKYKPNTPIEDNVNHPSHYTSGNVECIEAMIAAYGIEAVMNFCKCNAFKYQWRFDKKNGTEDINKAQWYQDKYKELHALLYMR